MSRPLTRRSAVALGRLFALTSLSTLACTVEPSPDHWEPHSKNWQLTFEDNFDGAPGTALDASKWRYLTDDVRNDGYGNGEDQWYTDSIENAFHVGDGTAIVRAIRVSERGPENRNRAFTSARIHTQGVFEQSYGAFEARLRLPRGKGLWPAFWLLGANIDEVGWPASGEADVMEMRGSRPFEVSGTLHGPGSCLGPPALCGDNQAYSGSYRLPGTQNFDEGFHVFRYEWGCDGMRWLVDGNVYHSRSLIDAFIADGVTWVYDKPMFLILNLAVGGVFDGPPNADTVFPADIDIDYVRAYTLPEYMGDCQIR